VAGKKHSDEERQEWVRYSSGGSKSRSGASPAEGDFNCDYFVRYCQGLPLNSPQMNTIAFVAAVGLGVAKKDFRATG
jgi:hypothetical protein